MDEQALTFSELRKIQKEEERQEELTELADNFLLQVRNYLESKKKVSGEDREYRNARRVFEKIISIREDKIVRSAKISAKSGMSSDNELMLPFEQQLFRDLRSTFEEHREEAEERTDPDTDHTFEDEDMELKTEPEEETEEQETDEEYSQVRITGPVPEFMGTDLETYGPFEEGEEVKVPAENAEILVNRGNAEEIA